MPPKKEKRRIVQSISVPPDLRKRMRAAARRESINWSAVACKGFERKLDALEHAVESSVVRETLEHEQAMEFL